MRGLYEGLSGENHTRRKRLKWGAEIRGGRSKDGRLSRGGDNCVDCAAVQYSAEIASYIRGGGENQKKKEKKDGKKGRRILLHPICTSREAASWGLRHECFQRVFYTAKTQKRKKSVHENQEGSIQSNSGRFFEAARRA